MIKQNFLTGEYVIFSKERENRPKCFKKQVWTTPVEKCPFCLNNKHMTFEPIYTNYNQEIRIVDNKYPIVKNCKENYGKHYVIIDTKDHNKNITNYTDEHMFYVILSLQDVCNILNKDEKLKHIQLFKNQGINAGASQSHSHWQILGLPIVPNKQKYITNKFEEYEKLKGECYFCSKDYTETLIYENKDFLAFCPEDSLYCYEINIIPKNHINNIKELDKNELKNLSIVLKKCIVKLDLLYKNIDYNICLYNGDNKKYHFFIQIIPRLGNLAGFEFSTGMFVNSILPKDAAKFLRCI